MFHALSWFVVAALLASWGIWGIGGALLLMLGTGTHLLTAVL